MPLTKFQSEVLLTLAAQRSPDSYIAGGVALNRDGPRFTTARRGWTLPREATRRRWRRLATASIGGARVKASGKRQSRAARIRCGWNG